MLLIGIPSFERKCSPLPPIIKSLVPYTLRNSALGLFGHYVIAVIVCDYSNRSFSKRTYVYQHRAIEPRSEIIAVMNRLNSYECKVRTGKN